MRAQIIYSLVLGGIIANVFYIIFRDSGMPSPYSYIIPTAGFCGYFVLIIRDANK